MARKANKVTAVPLHEAIRYAYANRRKQEEIATALDVAQPTVSRWASGKMVPSLDEIRAIEIFCGRPLGFILTLAGYVEASSVLTAIAADTALKVDEKRALELTYETFLAQRADGREHRA